jgi:predicted small secreted protein
MRRKVTLLLVLAGLALGAPMLAACNTTAGLGQDMQAGGRAMERSADRNR